MKIYTYHPITREYIGAMYTRPDPLTPTRELIPANATTLPPPSFNAKTQSCIFVGPIWSVSNKVDLSKYLTAASGIISNQQLPDTSITVIATEELFAGDFVNITYDSVTKITRVRLADGSDPLKPALGFVLDDCWVDGYVVVYYQGSINTCLDGLIIGNSYFLDPLNPGKVIGELEEGVNSQNIGYAVSETSIMFISKGITVDSITGTAPIQVTGGSDIVISMPPATTLQDGYLTSEDWTNFNNKLGSTDINYLGFDTTPTGVPSTEGTVSWNPIHHTLDLHSGVAGSSLQVGQEEWVHVKNISGIDIPTNFIVGVTGGSVSDDTPTVGLVSSSATDGIATTLGMATSSIPNNGFGFVTVRGLVHGFDTSSYSAGSVLYLSDTVMGGVTDVRPIPPSYTFAIAYTLDSAVDGVVYVRFGSPDAGVIATDAAVASQDPTGFINNNAITSTYDPAARTITLTGDLRYVWRGRVDSFVSPWTSPAHSTTLDTNYYLYSDDGINFTWHTDVWKFSDLIISYVYYGATDKIAAVETHGTMSWQAHEEFHTVIGTYKQSGGVLGAYVLNSTTAANRRPTVTTTVVKDEDILTSNPALTNSLYARMYLTGADVNTFTVDTTDIVALSTDQPYYNQFVSPNWVQTLMTNNSYMSIWLVAVPVTSDATSQKYRYLWVQGQTNGTLLAEQALYPQDLNLGQFKNLFTEFVFCAKVILQYTAGNWKFAQVTMLTGTKAVTVGAPSGVFLATVEHDTTLTGDGTVGLPLGVLLTADAAPLDTDSAISLRGTGLLKTTWLNIKTFVNDLMEPAIGLLYDADGNVMYDADGQAIITAGLSTQYIRADKTYADFATDMGGYINGASAATPNDTDLVATTASSVLKKITWANVKAYLKTYFDTLYTANTGTVTSVTAGTGLSGGTITTSGTIAVNYGTTSTTACAGNDARLSDARTPTAHTQTASTITDFATAALTAAPAETTSTIGALINSATAITTPDDTDTLAIRNHTGGLLHKMTWANVKSVLKTYFDTLYAQVGGSSFQSFATGDLTAYGSVKASASYIKGYVINVTTGSSQTLVSPVAFDTRCFNLTIGGTLQNVGRLSGLYIGGGYLNGVDIIKALGSSITITCTSNTIIVTNGSGNTFDGIATLTV